ncbi:hypothetical protein [Streptomyces sp. WMMB 322]|uniref:hypothetical protein n=1 Tax=Streptomyces sp. WMMB 322 TaxID=1286821 RepID=UPI000943C16F|nr:hypothetical protein [Streptomyces sp. WMMB 322]
MELDDVADELYGLRPQEFTAARDDRARRARAAGQRELAASIRALRRPTLAAWASNLLVREQDEQVAPLLRLGEELRGAHRNLEGAELRALSHQQHQLVNALSEQAGRLAGDAGQPLGAQAQHEVAQTLHAVLADPEAAREWAAGRLSKPLTATPGFEAAAREAAAAPPSRDQARKRSREDRRDQAGGKDRKDRTDRKAAKSGAAKRTEDARKAARAVRETADQARRRRREADRAAEETAAARAEREEAEERLVRLRAEVREAEEARKQSRGREKEAERAERQARRRAGEAEAAAERARRQADARGYGN